MFTDATPVLRTSHLINALRSKWIYELTPTSFAAHNFSHAAILVIQTFIPSLRRSIPLDICLVSFYSYMCMLGSTRHFCLLQQKEVKGKPYSFRLSCFVMNFSCLCLLRFPLSSPYFCIPPLLGKCSLTIPYASDAIVNLRGMFFCTQSWTQHPNLINYNFSWKIFNVHIKR